MLTLTLLMGLAAGTISFTLAWTSLFAPLRAGLEELHPKLGEFVHCPFCLNMWVMAALAGPLLAGGLLDWMVCILVLFAGQGVSGMLHFVLLRAYDPVAARRAMLQKQQRIARHNRNRKHADYDR